MSPPRFLDGFLFSRARAWADRADSLRLRGVVAMPQGTIKKIVADRGFGFISAGTGDVFFHHTSVADQKFDELHEGQEVTYEIISGPDARGRDKGPRATDVKPV
jgi:CspA family cold shock protein